MHLCSLAELELDSLEDLVAAGCRAAKDPQEFARAGAGKLVVSAFFEPSTRTRLSFEAAAHRIGAGVIGFSEAGTTSAAKGETLEDTIRVLAGYGDLIVLRHPEEGAAKRAAAVSDVPIINAGDGAGEHPTQAVLDLVTIQRTVGRIEGIRVAFVGDLRQGRTVHSLAPALRRLGAETVGCPVAGLGAKDDAMPEVSLEEAAQADVLYVTRVQEERGQTGTAPVVDKALLERTDSRAVVLHPLPRVSELSTDVDALPAANYFEQARLGVPVRMSILAGLLEGA